MNLEQEFDRVTAPPMKASQPRSLPREEIDKLVQSGQIKPLHEIPRQHLAGYEVTPLRYGGRGGHSGFKGKMRWR